MGADDHMVDASRDFYTGKTAGERLLVHMRRLQNPGAQNPGAQNPGAQHPEGKAPEGKAPEGATPEAKAEAKSKGGKNVQRDKWKKKMIKRKIRNAGQLKWED